MATTPNYEINYEDERFQQVETEKTNKLTETNNMYNSMVNNTDTYYQSQIDASKDWANKQTELQQAQSDLVVSQINQQKAQAEQDYTKEQKGAYTDYQKQINQYGANAEQMAANGLSNSGYSETAKVSMYNTYQNRYATAKDSFNRAMLNYDNGIKEAQLANSSKLAEIAYNALQTQLELSLQGFQYKNSLLLQQIEAVNNIENTYYNRYQDVLAQMNAENSLAEQVRQYNESLEEERRQYNETLAYQKAQAEREQANWEKQYALSLRQYNDSVSGGTSGGSVNKTPSSGSVNKSSSKAKGNTNSVVHTPKKPSYTNITTSTSSNLKTMNALKTFVNASNQQSGQKYTSAVAAARAKGVTSPYSEAEMIRRGIIRKTTVGGKTYYY